MLLNPPVFNKYPSNWHRISKRLRRRVGHCELCGSKKLLSVHHLGTPYADGRPSDPDDKRDLRRENLQVLCWVCHEKADEQIELVKMTPEERQQLKDAYAVRRAQRAASREYLKSLGVGTGIVVVNVYEHSFTRA